MVSPTVLCQVRSVLGVMALALTQGLAIGWSSPALSKLAPNGSAPIHPTRDEITWIVSLQDLGSMVGSWISTIVFTMAGRRQTILVGPVALTAWVFLTCFATSPAMLMAARLLSGCSLGIALSFSYIYVGEVTTPRVRGPLILAVTLLLPLGQAISYGVGPNVSWQVQSLFPLPFIVCIVILVLVWMQETPFYLAMAGREADMEQSLRALRVGMSEQAIQTEAVSIRRAVKQQKEDATSWTQMFNPPGAKKAAGIVLVESSALALVGVTNVLAYTQTIFEKAHGDIVPASTAALLVMLTKVLMVVVAMYLIENLGRRLQLTLASFGNALAMAGLTAYFLAMERGHQDMSAFNWVPLATLLFFIACVGAGVNTVPQVLMSELLGQRAKSVIAPICMTIMSLTSFGINKAFLPVGESAGYWVLFLLFTCTNTLIGIFTLFVVPETKGKSLVEVQDMLRGHRPNKEPL